MRTASVPSAISGVATERLSHRCGFERIAYVDIDAHHGNGVFYAYANDPNVYIVDIHEDGRHFLPVTGAAEETGLGPARGTPRNLPLPAFSTATALFQVWPAALKLLESAHPRFIILQCRADTIVGDPMTHLRLTEVSYRRVANDLYRLSETYCDGRLLALGDGGYEHLNLIRAWGSVVESLLG